MSSGNDKSAISLDKKDYPEIYDKTGHFVEEEKPLTKMTVINDKFYLGEDGELYPIKKTAAKRPPAPLKTPDERRLENALRDSAEKIIWHGSSGAGIFSPLPPPLTTIIFFVIFVLVLSVSISKNLLIIGITVDIPIMLLLIPIIKSDFSQDPEKYKTTYTITNRRVICDGSSGMTEYGLPELYDVKLTYKSGSVADVTLYFQSGGQREVTFKDLKAEDAHEAYSAAEEIIKGRK